MSMQSNILVNIIGEFQKKGFDDANKATKGLQGQFDKLGKKLLAAFSVAAVTKFAKASVKAFEEDQKAATRLTQTLRSMNLAFEDKAVKSFIADVERQTGILDDQLRPSMQRLLQTTGSVTKAQELLNLAIEVSRGSGVALETVAQDLSRAYVGQARGLAKYNIGLTAAELKSMSFAEVQQKITNQYKGQNAAYLETYSGKVDALGVAYANMQEVVGESLVNAFLKLSGDEGIAGATKAIEKFGQTVADTVSGATILFEKLGDTISPINTALEDMGINAGKVVDVFQGFGILGVLGSLQQMGEEARLASGFSTSRMSAGQIKAALAARTKAERDADRRAKQLEAAQKKSAAAALKREREQQQLKRAGTVFDMENIQIVAAMQGRINDEQRLRLTALLALNNDNAAAAEKLSLAILALNSQSFATLGVIMKSTDSVDDLITRLINTQTRVALVGLGITDLPKAKDPFDTWPSIMAKILADLAEIQRRLRFKIEYDFPSPYRPPSPPAPTPSPTPTPTPNRPTIPGAPPMVFGGTQWDFLAKEHTDALLASSLTTTMTQTVVDELTKRQTMAALASLSAFTGLAEFKAKEYGDVIYNINVAGSVVTEQDLANTLTNLQYDFQRAGRGLLYSSVAL